VAARHQSSSRWRKSIAPVEPVQDVIDEVIGDCAAILMETCAVTALEFLNVRTRFRFTGLYQADPPVLRNICLYDRENPKVNVSGAVRPLDETFCAIVCARGEPLRTADALSDVRLVDHAARRAVLSYCGVPIRDQSGRVRGTLCHFDVRPRLLRPDEVEVLEAVAPLFASLLSPAASVQRR
jgi:GAF domain-containing protein